MKTFTFNPRLTALIIGALCFIRLNAQKASDPLANRLMKPESLKEQKRPVPVKLGIGAEANISGDAHGVYYSANLNLTKGKSTVSLGPCLQKRTMEVNALKLSYSYLISGGYDRYDKDEIAEMKNNQDDVLELRLLCYVKYSHDAGLSYNAARVETVTNNESKINYNTVKFSTIEGALAAELDINLKSFKIRTYSGFTMFYHINYLDHMYRPQFGPALVFGAGFVIPHL